MVASPRADPERNGDQEKALAFKKEEGSDDGGRVS